MALNERMPAEGQRMPAFFVQEISVCTYVGVCVRACACVCTYMCANACAF